MPRVIGIDAGTLTLDLCGLDDDRPFLDCSLPTADALGHPQRVVEIVEDASRAAPLDLIVGPSGYGLPLLAAHSVTEADLRLACLAPKGELGGIGGLGSFIRLLGGLTTPVLLTPGVIHLDSVPAYRKVNRVDMGTADKVCAVVLGIHDQMARRRCEPSDVSFILLELGGAFSAALGVERGKIVDGVGGTSGPIGLRAAGALDGEVAYLAGSVSKALLFGGGVASIAGTPDATAEDIGAAITPDARLGWDAYIESAVKTVAALAVSVPDAHEVLLSGRVTRIEAVRDEFVRRLGRVVAHAAIREVAGFAKVAKHAAQGAALLADGLARGPAKPIVDTLGIREASGTVLDHLFVISKASAQARLGIS